MKTNTFTSFSVLLCAGVACLFSCTQEQDYKSIRKEVVAIHDHLMADAETAVDYQEQLDSLFLQSFPMSAGQTDTVAAKVEIEAAIAALKAADEKMMDWMNQFNPDVEGKSKEESILYFREQMTGILVLESSYKQAMLTAEQLLLKYGLKPSVHGGHGHTHAH